MLVYLAGPITPKDGYTAEDNARVAIHQFFRLIHKGINAFCPHLVSPHPAAWDIDYQRWVAYDFAMLDLCSHVLMLPRWETSGGAVREREHAIHSRKIVVYSETELC